jgi:hypothetical protein
MMGDDGGRATRDVGFWVEGCLWLGMGGWMDGGVYVVLSLSALWA